MIRTLFAAGALVLSACQSIPQEPAPPPLPEHACAALDSRDWAAWVNRMPGPGAQARLIVTGEIDLPTPGYTITLREGPADRSAIPMQHLILDLSPPAGMVAQVVTTETVRFEGRAIAAQYRGVLIRCAGQTLATINDVPDAL